MKVCIFTEGGPGVGFGHLTRCASVAQELVGASIPVEVIVQGPESCTRVFPPGVGVHIMEWVKDPVTTRHLCANLPAVIFDSYKPDASFYQTALMGFSGLPVFFDDQGKPVWARGVVVNGAPHAESLYGEFQDLVLLVGPRYQALRSVFKECANRICKSTPHRVLVTLGGDDLHSLAPEIYRRLAQVPEGWDLCFVTTESSRTCKELRTLVVPPHRLVIDADENQMLSELLAADLALIAAGQTTFEAARTGLPVVLVQVADNQQQVVKGWGALGYAPIVLDWETIQKPVLLEEALRSLVPVSTRARLAAAGQLAIDGSGAHRIVARIKELCRND